MAHLQQHAYAVGSAHHEREERHGVRHEVCPSTRLHRVAACSQPGAPRSDEERRRGGRVVVYLAYQRRPPNRVGTLASREKSVRFEVFSHVGRVQTCAARAASPRKAGRARGRVAMDAILEVRRSRPRPPAPRYGPSPGRPPSAGRRIDLLGSAESAHEGVSGRRQSSVHPPPILHERPNASRAKPVQHASSDPPRVSPPHTITPQDASERPSVLEHILAWLQAGSSSSSSKNEEREQLEHLEDRKKSAEPISEPPSAVTAAGFATRGAFAAAVLHTARAACAGVLRASSAKALATMDRRARTKTRARTAPARFLRARTLGPYATRRFFATIGFKPRWWHRRGYRGRVAVPEPGRRSAPAGRRRRRERVRRRASFERAFLRRGGGCVSRASLASVRPSASDEGPETHPADVHARSSRARSARRPWKRTHGGGLGARVEVTKRRGCRNVDDVHRLREDWHARARGGGGARRASG